MTPLEEWKALGTDQAKFHRFEQLCEELAGLEERLSEQKKKFRIVREVLAEEQEKNEDLIGSLAIEATLAHRLERENASLKQDATHVQTYVDRLHGEAAELRAAYYELSKEHRVK